MSPLLSIVIANYNYGRFLEDAIRSVVAQDGFEECELIVVDGGSTDNSIEIIKKHAEEISWWVSEKDNGQSDAFNKGFARAKGVFITWLNADDLLLPGVVRHLIRAHIRYPECEWFTGNQLQFRQDTKEIISAPWGPHWMPGFMQVYKAPLIIFGPTTFWSRDAYKKIGALDVGLHYSMDTDYWLRLKKAGYQQRRLNCDCWAFRMHDSSKTAQYGGRDIDEKVRLRWYEELRIIFDRLEYRCSSVLRVAGLLVRIIDGSALVSIYRRLFVVGKVINVGEWK